MRRSVTSLAALALVCAGSIGGQSPAGAEPAQPTSGRATPLAVTGFILGGAGGALVAREAHALATIGVDGVTINAAGTGVTRPTASSIRLVKAAHDHGLKAELLVSNFSSRLGDFDTAAAGRLLRDPGHVSSLARKLAGYVAAQGWDGVNVDLESLRRNHAAGLVRLVEELQERMPADKTVSIDLMASTSVADYRAGGYDLAEIARAADTVAVMTYDQHGPGWSAAGPVGGLVWQRRALGALMTKVPADQVDVGVAGYGYTWPRRGTGRAVSPRQARALVRRDGAKAVWKKGAGEWRARLSNGTVLWWSDARSYRKRVALARGLGVHGLALWRLGSADPLP